MADFRFEALNFATLCAATGEKEEVVESCFEQIGGDVPLTEPLLEHLAHYQKSVNLPQTLLYEHYRRTEAVFAQLRVDDLILRRDSPSYPPLLRAQAVSPRYLYLRGDVQALHQPLVAFIGSRNPSKHAQELTLQCSQVLQKSSYLMSAALAGGISAVALMNSLSQERLAVAVLESSLLETPSARYGQLQELVGEKGLLVTQFSPAQKSERWFAPLRNRLLALLSQAMLIIEEHDGGFAIHQAEYALQYQRPLLFFKESMANRSLLWPRRFQEQGRAVILHRVAELPKALTQLLQSNATDKVREQLSLFESENS